jgi:type I site-specific restriction endonuclease
VSRKICLVAEGEIAYLTPEAKARVEIDRMLAAAGWAVKDAARANLSAARGVAVRELVLAAPHGRADYLLFVDGAAAGVVEAKKEGQTLTGVEWQSAKYVDGLPDEIPTAIEGALPFAYESTGVPERRRGRVLQRRRSWTTSRRRWPSSRPSRTRPARGRRARNAGRRTEARPRSRRGTWPQPRTRRCRGRTERRGSD